MKETHPCVFCMYVHFMNHPYAYLRDDRKINFKMVSAQHFIDEAPELNPIEMLRKELKQAVHRKKTTILVEAVLY